MDSSYEALYDLIQENKRQSDKRIYQLERRVDKLTLILAALVKKGIVTVKEIEEAERNDSYYEKE